MVFSSFETAALAAGHEALSDFKDTDLYTMQKLRTASSPTVGKEESAEHATFAYEMSGSSNPTSTSSGSTRGISELMSNSEKHKSASDVSSC